MTYQCPHVSEEYENCQVQYKNFNIYHVIFYKYPKIYHNININNTNYTLNKNNEVTSVEEKLSGPILTNLSSLGNTVSEQLVVDIINSICMYLLRLRSNKIIFDKCNLVDFGKYFCKYICILTVENNNLTTNFLEKNNLMRTTSKTNNEIKVLKKILIAFLFDKISNSKKEMPPSTCVVSLCKLKKYKIKFPAFDYTPIHQLLCCNVVANNTFPIFEAIVKNERN